jgi:hypothetical protein
MKPLLPRISSLQRQLDPAIGASRRTIGSVALMCVLAMSVGVSTSPAWAQEDPGNGSIDAIINSPEAKNDRNGAPTGNNLIAMKTNAATDVSKRQRLLDRLADELGSAPVDCGQNAALATRVADTGVVLSEVAGRIASATELKAAKSAASELFPKTRVFSLVQPQVKVALHCGELAQQVLVLNGRIVAAQQTLESLKPTPEVAAATAQIGLAQSAVKTVPSLAQASAAVATLLPDEGDATVANANAAAIGTARTQVNQAEAIRDTAAKTVKDLERSVEQARKKQTVTTKPKKKQK